jgi:hypothetical protein
MDPELLRAASVLHDNNRKKYNTPYYLELPVIGDLFYRTIVKGERR